MCVLNWKKADFTESCARTRSHFKIVNTVVVLVNISRGRLSDLGGNESCSIQRVRLFFIYTTRTFTYIFARTRPADCAVHTDCALQTR